MTIDDLRSILDYCPKSGEFHWRVKMNSLSMPGYDAEKANMAAIKDKGLEFFNFVGGLGNSREISLAKTKIEEAVMWAVKHITA